MFVAFFKSALVILFPLFARLKCSWYSNFYATPRALWDSAQVCLVDVDIILEVEVCADVEFYVNIDVDAKDV